MFRRRDRGSRDDAGDAPGQDLEVDDATEAADESEDGDGADQPEDMDADLESQAADYLADNDVWLYGPHARESWKSSSAWRRSARTMRRRSPRPGAAPPGPIAMPLARPSAS